MNPLCVAIETIANEQYFQGLILGYELYPLNLLSAPFVVLLP